MCDNSNDIQLLADGCTALLQSVFGDNNWYRWNEIKQQTQHDSLQTFITWMLDVAEQEINRPEICNPQESQSEYTVMEEQADEQQEDYEHLDTSHLAEHVNQLQHSFDNTHGTVVEVDQHYPAAVTSVKQEEMMSGVTAESVASVSGVQAVSGELACVEIIYDQKVFFCSRCQVSLNDIEIVKEHLHIRHSQEETQISCFCCSQKFSSVSQYVSYHRQSALLTAASARNKFVCNECAKSFNGRNELEDHVANKHLKTGPRHQCAHCHKRFSHACNLSRHRKKCMSAAAAPAPSSVPSYGSTAPG